MMLTKSNFGGKKFQLKTVKIIATCDIRIINISQYHDKNLFYNYTILQRKLEKNMYFDIDISVINPKQTIISTKLAKFTKFART